MSISDQDKQLFLLVCKESIQAHLNKSELNNKLYEQLLTNETAKQHTGLFITLNHQNQLRGCIGCITSNDPLHQTLPYFAIQAAFNDHRFHPLNKEELKDIDIKISILTPPVDIHSYKSIQLGTHGIIFKSNNHQSVFLPEVATDQGWDLETTLQQLEKKAGAPPNSWATANYQVFESTVF